MGDEGDEREIKALYYSLLTLELCCDVVEIMS
jgi:hypothetical protein